MCETLWKCPPKPNQVFLLPKPDQGQQTEKLAEKITSELCIKIMNELFST